MRVVDRIVTRDLEKDPRKGLRKVCMMADDGLDNKEV